MSNQAIRKQLSRIYRIVEAGEKGYATAAANVSSPGLKIFFKYLAQQRAQFNLEILAELNRLGETIKPASSIPGMIHRGRVNIFAFMADQESQRERVVLKEVILGEKIALRIYQDVLSQDLTSETQGILRRQMEEIQKASIQVNQLVGQTAPNDGIRLTDLEASPKLVIQSQKENGSAGEGDLEIDLTEVDLYEGKGATVLETVLSGAFGGALWGSLIGILAGIGVLQMAVPATESWQAGLILWFAVVFGFLLIGAFISSILAMFIGLGIAELNSNELQRHTFLNIKKNKPLVKDAPAL